MDRLHTDMDYRDEVSFQKKSGLVKQILQVLLLLIVLGGLTGIFGYGSWTKKTSGNKKSCAIEYQKFLRVTKKTPLTFFINTKTADTLKIKINTSYTSKVTFENIKPTPFKISLEKNNTIFYFLTEQEGVQIITFNSVAGKAGNLLLSATVNDYNYLINQFVYP